MAFWVRVMLNFLTVYGLEEIYYGIHLAGWENEGNLFTLLFLPLMLVFAGVALLNLGLNRAAWFHTSFHRCFLAAIIGVGLTIPLIYALSFRDRSVIIGKETAEFLVSGIIFLALPVVWLARWVIGLFR